MENKYKKIVKNFEKKGYEVNFFETKENAVDYLEESITGKNIGFGDSLTLDYINLKEKLSLKNNVIDPGVCKNNKEFIETARKSLTTDIFITSVNAVTESGELINIDDTGNRIAGSLFGHDKVYFIIGLNKLTLNLEAGINRARNLAAPLNARRLKLKTPCTVSEIKCYDCSSKSRICNGMMIYYNKMNNIEMEIILINENLGY